MEIIIILLILLVIIVQIAGIILQNKNDKQKNIEMVDILNKNAENEKEIFFQIENYLFTNLLRMIGKVRLIFLRFHLVSLYLYS